MRRLGAPLYALLSFAAAASTNAQPPGPVCRLPAVVDEMTREVREHNYYSQVDPRLITETATPDPGMVRCQVCVQLSPYAQTEFGDQPIRQCVEHRFGIRILSKGFVVHDLN